MRTTRTNKVIVLGAGASRPAGIPLIDEFLWEGMQEAFLEKWDELEPLNEFWKQTRGLDLYSRPTVEDGVPYHSFDPENARLINETNIEKVLEEAENLMRQGKLSQSIPEGIRQFIFRVISSRSNLSSLGVKTYGALIEREILTRNDQLTVISFNYDTILERVLLQNNRHTHFSYMLPSPLKENFDSYERDHDGSFDYLKLHGSLNWLRCTSCDKFTIRWYDTYRPHRGSCRKCQTPFESVLVPPGTGKEGYLKPIQTIWDIAGEKISVAEEIIVIGYSFRPADVAASALFSENLRVKNKINFSLTIVDNQPKRILNRFSELGISADILSRTNCVEGFERYADVADVAGVLRAGNV